MDKRKNIVYGVALMVLVVIGLWLVSGSLQQGNATAEVSTVALGEPGVVTKAHYDQLETGMSYEQAEQLIGKKGEEQVSTETGGIATKSFAWYNQPPTSFVTATFQNNKLISKTQVGL
jgi:hypothetical protein